MRSIHPRRAFQVLSAIGGEWNLDAARSGHVRGDRVGVEGAPAVDDLVVRAVRERMQRLEGAPTEPLLMITDSGWTSHHCATDRMRSSA
ncbi:hypothetical protein ACFRQM_47880 [Streptomyces sp. NPDC056831]|uniref:hypothetical protein n=1 Tax=Streptomyces sp. NPDC056831 TaxID=3345954 RepID=UPI00369D661E